jgi:hypothetical protein
MRRENLNSNSAFSKAAFKVLTLFFIEADLKIKILVQNQGGAEF